MFEISSRKGFLSSKLILAVAGTLLD